MSHALHRFCWPVALGLAGSACGGSPAEADSNAASTSNASLDSSGDSAASNHTTSEPTGGQDTSGEAASGTTSHTSDGVSAGSGDTTATGESSTTDASTSTTGDLPSAVAVYVSSNTNIHHFAVDLDTGALSLVGTIEAESRVAAMTHDPVANRLWVARITEGTLLSYDLDDSGNPTFIADTDVNTGGTYLALSEQGPHLLIADFAGDKIASFGIEPNGAVSASATSDLSVGNEPHSIVLSPDRRFAFVPHRGGEEIRFFHFDATSGELTANNPASVAVPPGTGPRHMLFSADAQVAWVANENGDSVTTWAFDADAGTLSNPVSVSTLPDGEVIAENRVADLHATPDGRFLFVSNRGHNTLARFEIQDDGSLVAVDHTATEARPRSFAIEPGGRYLYAAGQNSGNVAGYRIGADGALEPLAAVVAPPEPVWVEAVALDAS